MSCLYKNQILKICNLFAFSGVTTFNCNLCEKGFNTNYLLKKHMQKAHDLELTEKVPRADQVIIAQQEVDDVSLKPSCVSINKRNSELKVLTMCCHLQSVFVALSFVFLVSALNLSGRVGRWWA